LVAPTIGAEIADLLATQASATCAIGTPRAAATRWTASTISLFDSWFRYFPLPHVKMPA